MNRTTKHISIYIVALSLMLLSACNPTKKIGAGNYLLKKNIVDGKLAAIDKSELESYIHLKPNFKLLGLFKFHLWLHNIANEERIKKRRIRKNEQFEKRNEQREAKGKSPKTKKRKLLGERLLDAGEAPVIYDSAVVKKSVEQIKLYLNNKGYFLSTVHDSVHYHKRRKTAVVHYKIKLNAPYTINKITYEIKDKTLEKFVLADTLNSLLKVANNYDIDAIQEERERITYHLNNNGYYLFNKEYIYFKIDTFSNKGKADIVIGIKNYQYKTNSFSDTIIQEPHHRFYIRNIYIETDYMPVKNDSVKYDTLIRGDKKEYKIIYHQKMRYKPKVLMDAVFLYKNDAYQFKNVENTYKRLSELRTFKFVNIRFEQLPNDSLDCIVEMSPQLKQSITIETEGTNSAGNLGISGSIVYQNKNLLKGAELLELKLKGGISAQRILTEQTKKINSNAPAFNTVEFGPELNIFVPRFLLPFAVRTYKLSNPKTVFTSGVNYQQRPDYSRVISDFSLSYTWRESAKKQHTISPIVLDFVKVNLSSAFENLLLTKVQNKFIAYSFSNHLTTSTRYSFVYSEQDTKKDKSFSYFRGNVEFSGNILRGIYNLTNQLSPRTFIKDNQDRYTILGIAYAQYLRTDIDYRYYLNLKQLGRIVFRVAGGIGKPLSNFKVLPFERSFYSGGANGLRAWQLRTIGPGSYFNQNFSYDRFGDGQLEANIEHRFKIFKLLNGAVFIDAGNVWLEKPDATRAGGEFKLNRFYKEIAIGSGIGARLDFSFFIIRLDMGVKMHDPQFAQGNRWVITELFDARWKENYHATYGVKYSFTTFNLGIGYPF